MLTSHEKNSDERDQSFESHHCMTKIVSELVISYNQDGVFCSQYVPLHSITYIFLPLNKLLRSKEVCIHLFTSLYCACLVFFFIIKGAYAQL